LSAPLLHCHLLIVIFENVIIAVIVAIGPQRYFYIDYNYLYLVLNRNGDGFTQILTLTLESLKRR